MEVVSFPLDPLYLGGELLVPISQEAVWGSESVWT
jgi:hypothetical protein